VLPPARLLRQSLQSLPSLAIPILELVLLGYTLALMGSQKVLLLVVGKMVFQ
jgi:hypothetical protein